MKPILIAGTTTVLFALAAYTIAIITEQRQKKVTRFILTYLTIGVILDLSATVMMIIGSSKTGITLHGVLGYSALFGMFTDAVFLYRLKIKSGFGASVPHGIHMHSRFAYIWWVVAFITGSLLVMLG